MECAAADVEDDRLRRAAQAIAPRAESPTEVDLLLVGEEARVQPAHTAVDVGADEEARARCPKDVGRRVVLSAILLHDAEHTPTTEGISVAIDPPTGRPGILEERAVAAGE